jgi:hypothetical protein
MQVHGKANPNAPCQIGYCTNVHPGRDLASIHQNLIEYSIPIHQRLESQGQLGVGLWFSEVSANEVLEGDHAAKLKHQLDRNGLVAFTLNGFPQGDFHSQIVKHRVYQPTWWDEARFSHTKNLIEVLHRLLPDGQMGSISTVPIAWKSPAPNIDQLTRAASQLMDIARTLHALYETAGREIVLAIEPEPGCYLTDSQSFRNFYERFLSEPALSPTDATLARKYLTLCHDVCHAAVMFEDQQFELTQTLSHGIRIGKVQISSAVEVDWNNRDAESEREATHQLSQFAENRYLHQTLVQSEHGQITFYEDLHLAMQNAPKRGKWRVHFHVPIFVDTMGALKSTRDEILKGLQILKRNASDSSAFTGHYEVETYAWNVLPQHMQADGLVAGIAKEMAWFREQLSG